MRRMWMGFAAAAVAVVASGMWLPVRAAVSDFGIDQPSQDEIVGARSEPVQVHASSDSSAGLQYMRLEVSDGGGPYHDGVVWCAPGTAPSGCTSWSNGSQPSYNGSYSWNTGSLPNGDYNLILTVKEQGGTPVQQTTSVHVNVAPQTPSWQSVTPSTSSGTPKVTLKWSKNPETDILEYDITRSKATGGNSTYFKISAANPGQQGCSLSGTTYTCTDTYFSSPGYGGSYTYYLSAKRNSPVSSSGIAGGQAARQASVTEPTTPSNTNGGGSHSGGSGSGPTSTPTSNNGGYIPPTGPNGTPGTLIPTPADPNAYVPTHCDFYCGTYQPTLPYDKKANVRVEAVKERREAAGFQTEEPDPTDPRKTLVPVAGGFFTVLAAFHFRRMLRDA